MYGLRIAPGRFFSNVRTGLRCVRRLRYVGSGKGFGVQSPWAYRFVRYVIGEPWPYYAYDELTAQWPDISSDTRKLCRLYLRVANFCQALSAVDYAPTTGAYAAYMRAGCRRTVITDGSDIIRARLRDDIPPAALPSLVRMSVVGSWREFYDSIRAVAHNGLVLIVEGIDDSKAARALWREIRNDAGCTLTFDLGLCGIVYFDDRRHKQHYTVNF